MDNKIIFDQRGAVETALAADKTWDKTNKLNWQSYFGPVAAKRVVTTAAV